MDKSQEDLYLEAQAVRIMTEKAQTYAIAVEWGIILGRDGIEKCKPLSRAFWNFHLGSFESGMKFGIVEGIKMKLSPKEK